MNRAAPPEDAPLNGGAEPPSPRPRGLQSRLGAFSRRNYRLFWTGQLVSLIGTWMQSVAQAWLVLQITDSAFQVGLVTALQFAPVLLLGMVGGVAADRWNKRRLLVMTQSMAALIALLLGLLIVTGHVRVYHVMIAALLAGTVNAFDIPTRQSFVVEMVGREHLLNAIALNSSEFNAARIIGPAIGGVLIAAFGVGPVYLINAGSFLAVILSLLLIREAELFTRPPQAREGLWPSLRSGLRYVRVTPMVQAATLLVGGVATVGMNFTVLLSVMARDVFKIGSGGYGLLMAALGIGSVLAGLFIAFRTRLDPVRTMLLGAVGLTVLDAAFALSPFVHFLPLSYGLLVGIGFAAISMTATANSAIQERVPDELRGRVMSVYVTVFAGSVPLGSLFAGSVAREFGAPVALGAGALLSAVVIVWVWRILRRAPLPREGAEPLAVVPER